MSQPPSPTSPNPDNEHLSFPTFNEDSTQEILPSSSQQPRQLLKDRLYIGNLHPSVDEFSLLQMFSKFGKVTKLDFLFHKAGVLKGKPRGYAFLEYGSNDEAAKALTLANDKLFRGRKLIVTYAQQAPFDPNAGPSKRRGMAEVGRPTTLSLLKSGMGSRQEKKTDDKIAMMEAKLRQMEATKQASIASSSSQSAPTGLAALPAKPPPPLPPHLAGALSTHSAPRSTHKSKALPSLPLAAPSQAAANPSVASGGDKGKSSGSSAPRPAKAKLIGIKLTKPKKSQPEDPAEKAGT